MESVFFLLDTFGKQKTAFNDMTIRCERLQKVCNDYYVTLQYVKSTFKQKTRQNLLGGSSFDVEGLLNFDPNLTTQENILNVIYQIDLIWPYIKNKADLLNQSLLSCKQQANVCQKLANPLNEHIQASVQKNQIDKIVLIAFNSDMAQLDARVSVLLFICGSLFEDFNDLMTIVTKISSITTDPDLINMTQLLFNSSKQLQGLITEIHDLSKSTMGAPLINPRFLETTSNVRIVDTILDSSAKTIEKLQKI